MTLTPGWRGSIDRAVEADVLRLDRRPVTQREVAEQVELANANLTRAARNTDDPDVAYRYLYEALVVLASALTGSLGYAARGEGGHDTTLAAAQVLFTDPARRRWEVLVRRDMRRRRHELAYERLHAVDAEDLELATALVEEFAPTILSAVNEAMTSSLSLPALATDA